MEDRIEGICGGGKVIGTMQEKREKREGVQWKGNRGPSLNGPLFLRVVSGFLIKTSVLWSLHMQLQLWCPCSGATLEANHFMCLFDSSQLPFTEGLYHFYHNGLAKARRKRSLHHKQLLERDPRVSFPGNLSSNFCHQMQAHWGSIKRVAREFWSKAIQCIEMGQLDPWQSGTEDALLLYLVYYK